MITNLLPFVGLAAAFIFSPGPGNALLAVSGARFGFARTVPFWMGFDLCNALLCLLYAFTLGEIISQYPQLFTALKYIGTIYIFYIAYKFFTASKALKAGEAKAMSFKDGFLSVCVNPKIHSAFGVLFTQFIDPSRTTTPYILLLVAITVFLSILGHALWIICGDLIFRKFQSKSQLRAQNIGFGLVILAVGIYTLFH